MSESEGKAVDARPSTTDFDTYLVFFLIYIYKVSAHHLARRQPLHCLLILWECLLKYSDWKRSIS